jgi:hypothetical protein
MRKRFRLRTFAGLTGIVAAATVIMVVFAGSAGAIVAGAGYSTTGSTDNCIHGTAVNCNAYASKTDVYVSGGPTAGGIKTSGDYYFAIIAPGSQNTFLSLGAAGGDLSLSGGDPVSQRTFHVDASGSAPVIDSYAGTTHDTTTNTVGKFVIDAGDPNHLYSDTPNAGGVYILAICSVGATSTSQCKFDAFRVTSSCTSDCGGSLFGTVSGAKYYDRNRNGQLDGSEPGIAGWPIDYADGAADTVYTDSSGAFSLGSLLADTYTFTEEHPNATTYANWHQTGELNVLVGGVLQTKGQAFDTGGNSTTLSSFVYTTTVVDNGVTTGLNFGNVCQVSFRSMARTMGYWANNGNSSITLADIESLQAIALVAADNGTLLTLAGTLQQEQAQIKTLINGATSTNAKNMAFMLSGQLIALVLNVNHGFLIGTDIYTPDGRTFNQIITDATTLLAGHNNTQSKSASDPGGTYRTLQGAIKNLIDTINNTNGQNLTVVPYYLDDTGGTNTGAFARCGAPSLMFPQP